MQKGFVEQLGDFAGEETLMLIVSSMLCVAGILFFGKQTMVSKLGGIRGRELPFYAVFACSFALMFVAVRFWAEKEVRNNSAYLLLVMLMGGAFLTLTGVLFRWLGVSLREDAFERRNFAAVIALCGAIVGALLIYTGANLGAGPSFWNNIFGSVLGSAAWFGLWLAVELGGRVSASITEERDLASGARLAGFLAATGLICGRALAGDWHSVEGTAHDFVRDGWPAILLVLAAIIEELVLRPNVSRPFPSWKKNGLAPALLYLLFALGWVWHLGWWEGAS